MVESIGAMLARLRTAQGRSQLRVAEAVCAASGASTVSRHEISRWEREARIPGRYWLRWLAHALAADPAELERAAARARRYRPERPHRPGRPRAGAGRPPGPPPASVTA